jgi:hypothetical protein
MHLDRSVDNVERYKVVKKTAKWVVSETRGQMYDGLYQRLGTKEGEKDIYRMAKSRERKMRDIIQVKCIKDVTERLLTKDEDIKNRLREYFDKLFNEDSGSSSIELDKLFWDIGLNIKAISVMILLPVTFTFHGVPVLWKIVLSFTIPSHTLHTLPQSLPLLCAFLPFMALLLRHHHPHLLFSFPSLHLII